ncbi:unnamed protein product, partial [Rotaria sp. Silwood2]
YSSKDAVCSLSWNPTQQNRFTCSTMAGEYAHVDISEYISKSTRDKEESEVEKMRTISGDDESESISNDDEEIKEEKEIIPKWFERASPMINERK